MTITIKMYSKNEILMTQSRLRDFITVIIDFRSMTDWSSIVTELNSRNVITDQIVSLCRPSQHHYFHCSYTFPSGGKASCVHGPTMLCASASSRLRRRRRRSLFSFIPKGVTSSYCSTIINGSTTRQASCIDILLFICFKFDMFFDAF